MRQNFRIYPDGLAEMMKAHSGEKYRPSNGTEGMCFMESWCEQCGRDKHMSEGKDYDLCNEDEICEILGATMLFDLEDPDYPKEWQYGEDGQPCCTAFIRSGEKAVYRDPLTADMFEKASQ